MTGQKPDYALSNSFSPRCDRLRSVAIRACDAPHWTPISFLERREVAASGGLIAAAVAIGMSVWRAREAKNAETYGSARWAEPGEIERARLLGPDGVVLGRYGRAYLRHDGPEHVLCFAPTRSGKGVGLVIPSLLTWSGSAKADLRAAE